MPEAQIFAVGAIAVAWLFGVSIETIGLLTGALALLVLAGRGR